MAWMWLSRPWGTPPPRQQAVDITRNGGTDHPDGNSAKTITIDMQAIVTRELTVRGTYGFNEHDFAAAILPAHGRRWPEMRFH